MIEFNTAKVLDRVVSDFRAGNHGRKTRYPDIGKRNKTRTGSPVELLSKFRNLSNIQLPSFNAGDVDDTLIIGQTSKPRGKRYTARNDFKTNSFGGNIKLAITNAKAATRSVGESLADRKRTAADIHVRAGNQLQGIDSNNGVVIDRSGRSGSHIEASKGQLGITVNLNRVTAISLLSLNSDRPEGIVASREGNIHSSRLTANTRVPGVVLTSDLEFAACERNITISKRNAAGVDDAFVRDVEDAGFVDGQRVKLEVTFKGIGIIQHENLRIQRTFDSNRSGFSYACVAERCTFLDSKSFSIKYRALTFRPLTTGSRELTCLQRERSHIHLAGIGGSLDAFNGQITARHRTRIDKSADSCVAARNRVGAARRDIERAVDIKHAGFRLREGRTLADRHIAEHRHLGAGGNRKFTVAGRRQSA